MRRQLRIKRKCYRSNFDRPAAGKKDTCRFSDRQVIRAFLHGFQCEPPGYYGENPIAITWPGCVEWGFCSYCSCSRGGTNSNKKFLNWVKENLKWSLLTRPVDITWTIPTNIIRQRRAGPGHRVRKKQGRPVCSGLSDSDGCGAFCSVF